MCPGSIASYQQKPQCRLFQAIRYLQHHLFLLFKYCYTFCWYVWNMWGPQPWQRTSNFWTNRESQWALVANELPPLSDTLETRRVFFQSFYEIINSLDTLVQYRLVSVVKSKVFCRGTLKTNPLTCYQVSLWKHSYSIAPLWNQFLTHHNISSLKSQMNRDLKIEDI